MPTINQLFYDCDIILSKLVPPSPLKLTEMPFNSFVALSVHVDKIKGQADDVTKLLDLNCVNLLTML